MVMIIIDHTIKEVFILSGIGARHSWWFKVEVVVGDVGSSCTYIGRTVVKVESGLAKASFITIACRFVL
jgi:hypothetical protein